MSAVKYIDLDGTPHPVRYDINALCDFEEITGKNLLKSETDFDTRSIRALVYVGLKGGAAFAALPFKWSLAEVGSKINENKKKIPEFIAVMKEQMKSGEEGEAENADKPGE